MGETLVSKKVEVVSGLRCEWAEGRGPPVRGFQAFISLERWQSPGQAESTHFRGSSVHLPCGTVGDDAYVLQVTKMLGKL